MEQRVQSPAYLIGGTVPEYLAEIFDLVKASMSGPSVPDKLISIRDVIKRADRALKELDKEPEDSEAWVACLDSMIDLDLSPETYLVCEGEMETRKCLSGYVISCFEQLYGSLDELTERNLHSAEDYLPIFEWYSSIVSALVGAYNASQLEAVRGYRKIRGFFSVESAKVEIILNS